MESLLGWILGKTSKKDMQLPMIAEVDLPTTVADAIELMMVVIPKQVQDEIRSMDSEDVGRLHRSLGMWVRNNFQLWSKDSEIRKQIGTVCADNASDIIVWAFWERLQQSECLTKAAKS